MKTLLTLILAFVLAPALALAGGVVTYDYDGDFDEASFALESAIVDRGLVVEAVNKVGEMLARTKADVGGEKDLFVAADVYEFCSATLSRKVIEADLANVAFCPYKLFVADTGQKVMIGYSTMPEGAMKEVERFLDAIAREAVDG